jgi:hypothetical protein
VSEIAAFRPHHGSLAAPANEIFLINFQWLMRLKTPQSLSTFPDASATVDRIDDPRRK